MIPAGYMAKKVLAKPDYLKTDRIIDVYSVSHCMSSDFADYVQYWAHNGYWLFDSPAIIEKLSIENSIDLSGTKIFYYEIYELEYDDDGHKWNAFEPEASFGLDVQPPANKKLEGFDVVTFYLRSGPEHSPLSCNALAETVATNEHCLLQSFEEAKGLLETGVFTNSEPGPYRIYAVYSVEKWRLA
jgi:hypothetical protein